MSEDAAPGVGASAAGSAGGHRSPSEPEKTAAAPGSGADLARQALADARARKARRPSGRTGQGTGAARSGSAQVLRRRRWSGAGPDARDPQLLGSALQKLLKQSGAAGQVTRATLFERWSEIVGATVADHCEPVKLVDGVLSLQCSSTAWAAQIRLLAPKLIATVNEKMGRGTVTRIQATGPSGPSWRFGPLHVPGRGPRDTYG